MSHNKETFEKNKAEAVGSKACGPIGKYFVTNRDMQIRIRTSKALIGLLKEKKSSKSFFPV